MSPCVRFLRQIGAAGFWVKRALCQEAVLLDWVDLRLSRVRTGVAAMELPIIYYGIGGKNEKFGR
jgi:hypothetical protein